MYRPVRAAAIVALALGLGLGAAGGASADSGYRVRVERVDVASYPTVRIVGSVTDPGGTPLKSLTRGDLLVTEDGKPVAVTVDVAAESAPVALAFIIDASGSMAGAPLQQAVAATAGLVQRLGPRDQAAIIAYRQNVDPVQALTADKGALAAAAGRVVPSADGRLASWRGLDEALFVAAEALSKATPGSRSAIVLVTDGFAGTSSATEKEAAIARAHASRYPIHPIAVGAQIDRATFQAIADASHGTAFYAPTAGQLAGAYAALGEQIQAQYTLSYTSGGTAPAATARRIRVQLVRAAAVLAEAATAYTVPSGWTPLASEPTQIGGSTVVVVPDLRLAAALAFADPELPDGATLGGLLAAGTTLCVALALGGLAGWHTIGRLDRRLLAVYVGTSRPAGPGPVRPSDWGRAALESLARLARGLSHVAPSPMTDGIRAKLAQADDPFDLGPAEFVGLRMVAALAGGVVGAVVTPALIEPSVALGILAGAAIGGVGYVTPGVLLDRAIRTRQQRIRRALPSTLDMLALSANAGMTLDGALAQVTQRWRGPLSDELRRLLLEFNLGRGRRVALRALATRTGVAEIVRLTNALIQADALGVPISRVLQEQAADLRTYRRQRAEEAARTAPVKMLFPMIGLIFPALFVVIIGPAVPTVMGLFNQVH